jgi:hypothetical protein
MLYYLLQKSNKMSRVSTLEKFVRFSEAKQDDKVESITSQINDIGPTSGVPIR